MTVFSVYGSTSVVFLFGFCVNFRNCKTQHAELVDWNSATSQRLTVCCPLQEVRGCKMSACWAVGESLQAKRQSRQLSRKFSASVNWIFWFCFMSVCLFLHSLVYASLHCIIGSILFVDPDYILLWNISFLVNIVLRILPKDLSRNFTISNNLQIFIPGGKLNF